MKKILLMLLILITTATAFSQKKSKDTTKVAIPIKDGNIFYEKVVDVEKSTKETIFNNSLKWMANTFVDSKEVIQLKDKETGDIVGAGSFEIHIPGFVSSSFRISIRLEMTVKDKKSRIRLYQYQYKSISTTYVDDYSEIDSRYKKYFSGQSQFPKDDKKLFNQLNEKSNTLLESYADFLLKNSAPDNF